MTRAQDYSSISRSFFSNSASFSFAALRNASLAASNKNCRCFMICISSSTRSFLVGVEPRLRARGCIGVDLWLGGASGADYNVGYPTLLQDANTVLARTFRKQETKLVERAQQFFVALLDGARRSRTRPRAAPSQRKKPATCRAIRSNHWC